MSREFATGPDHRPAPAPAASHLYAYSVEEYTNADGKPARSWTRIGVAFPHKDGTGFNIQLRALPVDGRIVLFPPNDDTHADDARDEPPEATPPGRGNGNRRR